MKRFVIVLATLLNVIVANCQTVIDAQDAAKHIGEVVTVCGKIFSAKYLKNAANAPTLLNMGGNYPNHLLTIAIFEVDRKNFPFNPEDYYPNTEICVTGKMIEYKGSPEIVVQNVEQVKLQINQATNTPATTKPSTTKGPVESAKSSKEKKPKELPAADQYDIKLTSDVNLRSGPGPAYAIITELKAGSIVTFLRSSSGWSYVSIKKAIGDEPQTKEGYIKNNVLK
jgi:uncharacterized protein YgiM (DUF1202 family)